MRLSGEVSVAAILLLGGSGSRLGGSVPKQFLDLAGKKLYRYALDTFVLSPLIGRIVVICHADYIDQVKAELDGVYPKTTDLLVTEGGATRQQSVQRGLAGCSAADVVLIHDAARPFVTYDMIAQSVEAVSDGCAACVAMPCTDTLLETGESSLVTGVPDRSRFFRAQTPQTFRYSDIVDAHQAARQAGLTEATDDCSLMVRLGKSVRIIPGSEQNIKLTRPLDFVVAQRLIEGQISGEAGARVAF